MCSIVMILTTMLTTGRDAKATYTEVHLLHRCLQFGDSDPGCSVIFALPVTDLANGIGHVLEHLGELLRG